MPTQKEIYHEMFVYSDESPSFLFWNKRPLHHFETYHGWNTFNKQFAGRVAGSKTLNRNKIKGDHYYWNISKTSKLTRTLCKDIGVHRIIYTMFNGDIPHGMEIDHWDNDTLNNLKDNLRLVTKAQNQQNCRAHQSNHLKGAYPLKTGGWTSFIAKNKVRYYLGYFATEQLAHEAYCEASEKLHKEYGRIS